MQSNKTNETAAMQPSQQTTGYQVGWQSPSNIALIKYWGKTGDQIPLNPSLSMTLSKSHTQTTIRAFKKESLSPHIQLKYRFEGSEQPVFESKVSTYLEKIIEEVPFLRNFSLEVDSINTFPHSAGIASSASSMSALALSLVSLDNKIMGKKSNIHTFLKKSSNLARLGSGSASRSLYGNYVIWGKYNVIPKTCNKNAIPFPLKTHPLFMHLHDSILVIDKAEKLVSSRTGHSLMENHPFRKSRIQQANHNLNTIIKAINSGAWEDFSLVVENEALTLHSLMMSSNPGFLLLRPNTLTAIEKIQRFRSQNKARITFTLDAGPNLHVLYPNEDHGHVQQFIDQELAVLCENNFVIHDQIGNGPVQII